MFFWLTSALKKDEICQLLCTNLMFSITNTFQANNWAKIQLGNYLFRSA